MKIQSTRIVLLLTVIFATKIGSVQAQENGVVYIDSVNSQSYVKMINSSYGVHWGYSNPGYSLSKMDYLSRGDIQKQIDLSNSQKKLLEELKKGLTAAHAKNKAGYLELKNSKLDAKTREKINAEINDKYKKLKADAEKAFVDSLIPLQIRTIQQLQFNEAVRARGFTWAVSNKPFDKQVELTSEQVKELKRIKFETEQAIQKKMEEMRQAAKKEMLKVLDAKQRKTIKNLEGKSPPKQTRL